LLRASRHARPRRGRAGERRRRGALMLDRTPQQALSWKTDMTAGNGAESQQYKARRFRDAALPHLDDVYTLARYLLHDTSDAEDAVQERYLRALRHFDTFRGP